MSSKFTESLLQIGDDNDNELLRQVREGHPLVFAKLVDRYKDRAMTLSLRMVGNRQEAEEIVQDAFVNVFRSVDRFRGDARFGTWFYRILMNLCLTKVSRRKRNTTSLDEQAETFPELLEDPHQSPLQFIEQGQLQEIISRELDRLPEKSRAIIALFYIESMSYDEIAEVMSVPLGTVKTLLHRGRKMLRERVMVVTRNEVGEQ